MKRFFRWAKNKIVEFVKWVWQECKDWRTFVLFVMVCFVIGLPVWGLALLGIIFSWEWAVITAGVAWAFWMLPGTPFFVLCIATTLALKRFFEKKAEKQHEQEASQESEPVKSTEADEEKKEASE